MAETSIAQVTTGVGWSRFRKTLAQAVWRDPVTKLSIALTLSGWTLVWLEGLGAVRVLPSWAAATMFVLGLGLIPFSTALSSDEEPVRR